MIRVVPLEHAMGPSVITLLLDDSPLPTKDSVLEVADMISYSMRRTPRRERNLCVILGCLAEKLAGPSSIAVLSESTLSYLIGNLVSFQNVCNLFQDKFLIFSFVLCRQQDEGIYPEVMLFSIIALEKFAQKSENKATIKRKLAMFPENPLIRLERHANSEDYTLRQVGYCARWCLDNYCKSLMVRTNAKKQMNKINWKTFLFTVIIEGRKYSYEVVDVSNVNVMLNTRDVSEYLKISPDGLEARCDAYLFESVRCTYQVNSGCWYYEVTIITPGVMQIGELLWGKKHFSQLNVILSSNSNHFLHSFEHRLGN